MVNKLGWIKIVEASIAFVIIASVLLSLNISNQRVNVYTDYDFAEQIMNEMQANASIRGQIINENGRVLTTLDSFLSGELSNYQVRYSFVICDYMAECSEPEELKAVKREVYSTSRIVSADTNLFNPKIVRLFVWR